MAEDPEEEEAGESPEYIPWGLPYRLYSDKYRWDVDKAEIAYLLGGAFNVQLAKKLLVRYPRRVKYVEIAGMFHLLPGEDQKSHPLGPKIDRKYALRRATSLQIPLILCYVGEDKKGGVLPIDGWHRVYKARELGIVMLPCVRLTRIESRKVRC